MGRTDRKPVPAKHQAICSLGRAPAPAEGSAKVNSNEERVSGMRVMITGVDGYLGWALSMYLAKRGHEVGGIDNYSRRQWVGEGSRRAGRSRKYRRRARRFVVPGLE